MTGISRLDLQLTHRCNLRCSYCYAAGPAAPRPDLSPEVADAAVDLLLSGSGEHSRLTLELWGGEPFLRPDLIERTATRAKQLAARGGRRLAVGAATNVTLLDARALDLVERCELSLSLSVDGDAEGCASRRLPDGRPAFPLIEAGLAAVSRRWPGRLPPVRMTVAPAQVDHLLSGVRWLLELGFVRLAIAPASGARWTPALTERYDEQMASVVDGVAAHFFASAPGPPPELSPLMHRLGLLRVQQRCGALPQLAGTCGAGATLLAVDTEGALYPCHRFVTRRGPDPATCLGSVATGAVATELGERLRTLDAARLRCGACPQRGLCGFVCPAVQWQTTGGVQDVPDAICWFNERIARAARRLHRTLAEHTAYQRWIDAWLLRDPDGRLMEPLARAQAAPEALLEQASAHLEALGVPLDEPPTAAGGER